MKKYILGLTLTISIATAQQLSQYEALQKLNIASGKLAKKLDNVIQNNRIIENDIRVIKASAKLIKKQQLEIENLNSKVGILEKRLNEIEKKLNIKNNYITDEVVLKIKEELSSSLIETKSNNETNEIREYIVNTWVLNARKGNSIDYGIVSRYKVGDEIKAISIDNEWVKVVGTNKFLFKEFLVNKNKFDLVVTNDTLLRTYPSFKNKYIYKKLKSNTKLNAIARVINKNWYLLESGLFINKKYVKEL